MLLERNEHCPSCGLTDREFLEDPDAYVAMWVTCPWCAARDRVRADDDTNPGNAGASLKLVSKGTAQKMASGPVKRPKSRRERAKERNQ